MNNLFYAIDSTKRLMRLLAKLNIWPHNVETNYEMAPFIVRMSHGNIILK